MKKERTEEMIGGIDDKYIAEAAEYKGAAYVKNRRPTFIITAIAACIAVTAGILVIYNVSKEKVPKAEMSSLAAVSSEDSTGISKAEMSSASESVTEESSLSESTADESSHEESTAEESSSTENSSTESTPDDENIVDFPDRNYKQVYCPELAYIYPWEYLTIYEKYRVLSFNDLNYEMTGGAIDSSYVGELLGSGTGYGYDEYNDKQYTESFEVYEIKGLPRNKVVGVKLDGEVYPFREYLINDPPKDLAEFISDYDIEDSLKFNSFYVHDVDSYWPEEDTGEYRLTDNQGFFELIKECGSAGFINGDTWQTDDSEMINFAISHKKLGKSNRSLFIKKSGYIWTNICDYAYVFNIGTEAAEKLILFARDHCENAGQDDTEQTRKNKYIFGTITEITEDYVKIDDSMFCPEGQEGMVFKVPLDDIRVKRCVIFEGLEVGYKVRLSFTGGIDPSQGNLIVEPLDITKAFINYDGVYEVLE